MVPSPRYLGVLSGAAQCVTDFCAPLEVYLRALFPSQEYVYDDLFLPFLLDV